MRLSVAVMTFFLRFGFRGRLACIQKSLSERTCQKGSWRTKTPPPGRVLRFASRYRRRQRTGANSGMARADPARSVTVAAGPLAAFHVQQVADRGGIHESVVLSQRPVRHDLAA